MKSRLEHIQNCFRVIFLLLFLQSCGGEDVPIETTTTGDGIPFDRVEALGFAAASQAVDEGYALGTTIWDRTVINVCWENPQAAPDYERQWVIDAVSDTWSKHSRVRFVGWGDCATSGLRDIRIQIADQGAYVLGLGTRLHDRENGMSLNFSYNNWGQNCRVSDFQRERCTRAIAVHEFGHALGFAHEHNRPDTPLSCTDAPQGTNGDTLIGPWDAESTMNYCNENVFEISNTRGLSDGDIQMVQYFYGDNYCNGSPWHMYWNPELKDHFYSIEFFEARNGWEYHDTQVYICQEQVSGTVPYYSYWNETTADHFYTQTQAYGFFGYVATGPVGYVFTAPEARTKTLHRYWNSDIKDHFWSEIYNPYGLYGYIYEGEEYFVE